MNELLLRRRALMMAQKKSRLPSKYQEVEYLESTGTQIIATGINEVTKTDEFELVCAALSIIDPKGNLFGADNRGLGGTYYSITFFWPRPSESQINWGDTYNIGFAPNIGQFYDYKATLSEGSLVFSIDGRPVLTETPKNQTFYGDNNGFALFGRLRNGAVRLGGVGRISKFIYSRDLIKIRNFIPCYRKSDNKPGMYDLVSKTFFTNAGTGEFTVGPDVN